MARTLRATQPDDSIPLQPFWRNAACHLPGLILPENPRQLRLGLCTLSVSGTTRVVASGARLCNIARRTCAMTRRQLHGVSVWRCMQSRTYG